MSAWEYRTPAQFQLGNGTLLATFDGIGEIEQLFAPNIDALQSRVGSIFTRVLIPGDDPQKTPQVLAITPENFEIKVELQEGAQVFRAEYQHRFGPLKLARTVGIHPTEPLLLESWQILHVRAGLLHQSIPWMGNSTSSHCSMYHPSFNGLVHHRGRRWLGIMLRTETEWARVGHLNDHERARLWSGERLGAPIRPEDISGYPAGAVRHGWDQIVQGPATWGAVAASPSDQIEFMIVCAESERHLGNILSTIGHIKTAQYFHMIEGVVKRRHAPANPLLSKIKDEKVRIIAAKSIDVLHSLQDGKTGALMAAAEVDPHSKLSGGYGFSWPRDGAYLALALGVSGFRERVEHFFKFCEMTQDPSGTWWQRYLATGHAGPSWGRIQIDEPASVIHGAYLHYKRTKDMFWLEKNWPMITKGLSFLEKFHGPEHPLGLPSHDLWEERMGIHAYSLGAVAAAFHGGAYLAGELSDPKLQKHYAEWARSLTKIIAERFVTQEKVFRSYLPSDGGQGWWDDATDISLLGLIFPFGICRPDDPLAKKLVERVRTLWSEPVGGMLRYERDHYRGGNPWILTTLWLATVELQMGNIDEAKKLFSWSVEKSTPQGMLAEQVHRESGLPFWVIPLAWSHAMFLLFVKEVIDRKVEDQFW